MSVSSVPIRAYFRYFRRSLEAAILHDYRRVYYSLVKLTRLLFFASGDPVEGRTWDEGEEGGGRGGGPIVAILWVQKEHKKTQRWTRKLL